MQASQGCTAKRGFTMKRPLTPLDFVRRAIKLYPERTAILHGELRYSYRQWGERVWRLAPWLAWACWLAAMVLQWSAHSSPH